MALTIFCVRVVAVMMFHRFLRHDCVTILSDQSRQRLRAIHVRSLSASELEERTRLDSHARSAQVQIGEGFYDVVHKELKCIAEVADASRGDGHHPFIILFSGRTRPSANTTTSTER